MPAIFRPAWAVACATAPIAGQNVGAGHHDRVREAFRASVFLGSAIMFVLTLICQLKPEWFVHFFTKDAAVLVVAATFLHIISWNFVAQGIIFTCSGMFQALGNTLPGLMSSATRLVTFAIPAFWLASRPGFELKQLWFLSVATVTLQAITSLLLLPVFYAGSIRVPSIASRRRRADAWERDQPNRDPPLLQRAKHAHLNATENFAIFAAVVVIAGLTGRITVADSVACWVLYPRVAQSIVHMLGTSLPLIALRGFFYAAQVVLVFWMIFGVLRA
jgi:uncharacterized MAPEG superfamily protein